MALTEAREAVRADRADDASAWASAALAVHDHLADPRSRLSAMTLRAFHIRALGPRSGEPLLHPERIISWFRTSVAGTTPAAAASANGQESDRSDVRSALV